MRLLLSVAARVALNSSPCRPTLLICLSLSLSLPPPLRAADEKAEEENEEDPQNKKLKELKEQERERKGSTSYQGVPCPLQSVQCVEIVALTHTLSLSLSLSLSSGTSSTTPVSLPTVWCDVYCCPCNVY
jgi:hypothetical protein